MKEIGLPYESPAQEVTGSSSKAADNREDAGQEIGQIESRYQVNHPAAETGNGSKIQTGNSWTIQTGKESKIQNGNESKIQTGNESKIQIGNSSMIKTGNGATNACKTGNGTSTKSAVVGETGSRTKNNGFDIELLATGNGNGNSFQTGNDPSPGGETGKGALIATGNALSMGTGNGNGETGNETIAGSPLRDVTSASKERTAALRSLKTNFSIILIFCLSNVFLLVTML